MNKNGPILVIEDSEGAQVLLTEAFGSLPYKNELMFFYNGDEALEYLLHSNVTPFLILSDVNMPKIDGFSFKEKIQDNPALKLMCIPFLFFSTAATKKDVVKAYLIGSQGFFIKPASNNKLRIIIDGIMQYWGNCLAPNDL